MTTIVLALSWLIMAVIALIMAFLALRYTQDAPGPIAYIRAILFGAAVNYLISAVLVMLFLPGLLSEPRPITLGGIMVVVGFFTQTVPVIVFELYLIEKIDWLRKISKRFTLPE